MVEISMTRSSFYKISGKKQGQRIESRILEERMQEALEKGIRKIEIEAFGQHGIGGRLWKTNNEPVHVVIKGPLGQRTGSFGFPNTFIEVMGPASDDVGWLNAGAEIVIHGNAGNGVANAMAQGKVYIAGNIGARGMTMTKSNPRFDPPEVWVLGSAGDFFGEFMAGGISVVCGIDSQTPENIIGHRPFVGMVGGKTFFRGQHKGFSQVDAKLAHITNEDWDWFLVNLNKFLERIHRTDLYGTLSNRMEWQLIIARNPFERTSTPKRSMRSFQLEKWEKELGQGGIVGELITSDTSTIPLITTGNLRRFVPIWENRKFTPPCQATCPSGIPIHDRWRLIRDGRADEAVDMALAYTPFPATICGYLCPNLCMQGCTRADSGMESVDITKLGQASIEASTPELPPLSGIKVAVIGGGPAGISVAWQLRLKGHEPIIYDMGKELGGKLQSAIPNTRIPKEVLSAELTRVAQVIPHIHLKQRLEQDDVEIIQKDHDFIVIATGAQNPRILPVLGKELLITSLDFLTQSKENAIKPGQNVVVIGAGNVGCDIATEAHRLGAEKITLIDIQEPASFGREREEAEAIGAIFKWPCFTKQITDKGVLLTTGELIPAETVVISIGDMPDTSFLPKSVKIKKGKVIVNNFFQTSDPKIFAIGDIINPGGGLLTEAIGAGHKAADAITQLTKEETVSCPSLEMIDKQRVSLEYFDPRITKFNDLNHCGSQCASCGACRDCGICITICPQAAIQKIDKKGNDYEYIVDENKCIGCGFCGQACPCGIWNLTENTPLD